MTRRTGSRISQLLLPLLGLLALSGQTARASISATATFTDTQSSGVYSYDITLNNTGTTTIGTLWFAWIPGAGFMSVAPSNITSPSGWSGITTDGNGSIQWTTTTALLASGSSLSGFNYQSTLSPTQLEAAYNGSGAGKGDTVATTYVYIGAPEADPGAKFVVMPAVAVPEPSSFVLGGSIFLGGILGRAWCRRRVEAKQSAAIA